METPDLSSLSPMILEYVADLISELETQRERNEYLLAEIAKLREMVTYLEKRGK